METKTKDKLYRLGVAINTESKNPKLIMLIGAIPRSGYYIKNDGFVFDFSSKEPTVSVSWGQFRLLDPKECKKFGVNSGIAFYR